MTSPSGGGISGGTPGSTIGSCTATPAACLGATQPLPGNVPGTAASTLAKPGCETGRIVTPDAGGQSDSLPYCPDTDGDGVADAPPPPTHAEIVALLCPSIPTPAVGTSPPDRGYTGLDTWVWDASHPHTTTTSGTIRTYAVTCTRTPTSWTVDTGDPHAERYGHPRTHTATTPGGNHADTPIRHLWEVTGRYPLTMTVTWQRTTTAGTDTPTATTTRTLDVEEIRTTPTQPR